MNLIQLERMLYLVFVLKIGKLIYSVASASIGNRGMDKNLSPYAFTKAKNLEMLENLKNGLNSNLKSFIFIMSMDQAN